MTSWPLRKVKKTDAHELNHWLSDTMHNFHLTKGSEQYVKLSKSARMAQDATSTQSAHELDAQVQAIQQVKDTVGEEMYNTFDWTDLFQVHRSLASNFRVYSRFGKYVLQDANFDEMMKRFARRLHREGLLTQKMRKLPTRAQFMKLEKDI